MPKEEEKAKPKRKKFKEYKIGYVHVDITKVKIASKKKLYLFVAIDRVCKYAYLEVYENQDALNAQKFLENLIRTVPFKIHKILTDNGAQFTYGSFD